MRILLTLSLLICLALALPGWTQAAPPTGAQGATPAEIADETEQERADRGYIQAFLEDNLSGAGRDVRVIGLNGALSSSATIETLTIADADGVWITLSGLTLDWNRSALLRGRVEVSQLSADKIEMPRLPRAEDGLSPDAAVATPFSLPELPVSIQIGEISADEVLLGAPILGTEVELAITGSMSLAGGEGAAKLEIARADDRGAFGLDVAYANATDVLDLALTLDEAPDGIAATLLGLPGRPALSLEIAGNGPLSDYAADITLASDGAPRLSGTVRIAATQDPGARRFSAALEGDLRPLLAEQYRRFFGPSSGLNLTGTRAADGALDIPELSITAAALSLEGALALNAEGWPQRFQLQGTLGDGARLLLPVAEGETWIRRAAITAGFDANAGNAWLAELAFEGLEQGAFDIREGSLSATGEIAQSTGSVTGDVAFDVDGLQHTDAALARAMGRSAKGKTMVTWADDAPLELREMDLRAGDMRLTGGVLLDGLAKGFPAQLNVRLVAGDLSRFALLLDQPLAGSADARITGEGTLLGGAFDGELRARTDALQTGIAQLDPLLTGRSTLRIEARRDSVGTTLEVLDIKNDVVTLAASAFTDTTGGRLQLLASLDDLALVEPRLPGAVQIDSAARWVFGGEVTLEDLRLTFADAELRASGTVSPDAPGMPVAGTLTGEIGDLSRFARIAGQNLAGRVTLSLDGTGQIEDRTFNASVALDGNGLRSGIAELDKLLTGDVRLRAEGARDSEAIDIRRLSLSTAQVDLSARVATDTPGAPLNVEARLANLGLYAPDFSGPVRASGTVHLIGTEARRIAVDLAADGPGGTTAQVQGDILEHGARLDMALSGTAPLGLANTFIAPRLVQGTASYDLRINGAPGLAALSGTARANDVQLALPRLGIALQGGSGSVDLSGARAQVQFGGQFRDGGSVQVSGPVSLNAPYDGDLSVQLAGVRVTDNLLFATNVDGDVRVNGPLTGGALIAGTLNLGETNLRIPSTGAAESVLLDDIQHINAPADVTQTRRRAGLIKEGTAGTTRPFGLDVQINAPRRVFVRGRGVDAELGGRLRVTGDTNNVIPSGFFELIRGRLDILGKRLDLTEGLVDLRGALDPYLRFVAETTADDVIVQIIIEGLLSEIEIMFQSQPELPEEEVVSLLILGRGLDSISPFQAAQLASAVATLAGRDQNDIVGRLRKGFGLSDLDVTQTEEGTTEVTAGAYLSDNVYSEVTADSEGRQEINLNLDISRSVTIKGGVDTEGGTGIGVFFEKDY